MPTMKAGVLKAPTPMSRTAFRREATNRIKARAEAQGSQQNLKRVKKWERAMHRLRLRGIEYADRRTKQYLELKKWQTDITTQLGNGHGVSPLQAADIKLAASTQAIVSSLDLEILKQQSLMLGARKARLKSDVKWLLTQRAAYANELGRCLTRLHLKPRDIAQQTLPSIAELAGQAERHGHA